MHHAALTMRSAHAAAAARQSIFAMGVVVVSCGQPAAPPNPEPLRVPLTPQSAPLKPVGTAESKTVHVVIRGPEGPTTPTPPHVWPPGTPARDRCTADADCVVIVNAVPGADPCCDVTLTAVPTSRRFVEFVSAFRAHECAGVRCPYMTRPGPRLPPCGYEPRCVRGRCGNACGEPRGATPGRRHGPDDF